MRYKDIIDESRLINEKDLDHWDIPNLSKLKSIGHLNTSIGKCDVVLDIPKQDINIWIEF